MDKSHFTGNATGSLLPLERKQWAFIPDALPPKWAFANDLWPLVAEARECLGTLNGIGRTLPDPTLLVTPLAIREALTSSSLEGTYVTPQQLLLYGLNPREPRSNTDKAVDWQEVFNYDKALRRGCEMLESMPLSLRIIKEMHRLLMTGVRGRNRLPGEFRRWQVQVGSDGRFIPPPINRLDECLGEFEKYMNNDDSGYDPLIRSFLIHYQFEAIHPFADGNGRVGRALLALMIYKVFGHFRPWLYLSAFFEKFRDEYIRNLFRVSTHGDWHGWVQFCLTGTIHQAKDSISRCDGLLKLRGEYKTRLESSTGISGRTHPAVDSLFSSPIQTIVSLKNKFGVTYPTARDEMKRLCDMGILRELEGIHPKTYYAPEIIRIAYGDL